MQNKVKVEILDMGISKKGKAYLKVLSQRAGSEGKDVDIVMLNASDPTHKIGMTVDLLVRSSGVLFEAKK